MQCIPFDGISFRNFPSFLPLLFLIRPSSNQGNRMSKSSFKLRREKRRGRDELIIIIIIEVLDTDGSVARDAPHGLSLSLYDHGLKVYFSQLPIMYGRWREREGEREKRGYEKEVLKVWDSLYLYIFVELTSVCNAPLSV